MHPAAGVEVPPRVCRFLLDVAFYSQNLFQKDVFTSINWIPGGTAMNALTEMFKVSRAQARPRQRPPSLTPPPRPQACNAFLLVTSTTTHLSAFPAWCCCHAQGLSQATPIP